MTRRKYVALLLGLILSSGVVTLGRASGDIVQSVKARLPKLELSQNDLDELVSRKVMVRFLSSTNSKEIAGLGVILADASPEAFIESYRTLAVFRNSPHVIELGAFSAAPQLRDLEGLHVDNEDDYALSKAKVGDSDIKLSESEIRGFQTISAKYQNYHGSPAEMKQRFAEEYKKLLLERAASYSQQGTEGMEPYADKPEKVNADQSIEALAGEEAQSGRGCEHVWRFLQGQTQASQSSQANSAGDTTLLYWAKEKFGELKNVINILHIMVHREGDRFYIASRQVYSSHYTDAAMSVAEFIPFTDSAGQVHTIITYSLRLQPDMLGGTLGFVKKRMAAPRILGSLKDNLERLQATVESDAHQIEARK
ncbi:MAG TPA: hypothetical protein VI756_30220 [Blastocatellia bacterium]